MEVSWFFRCWRTALATMSQVPVSGTFSSHAGISPHGAVGRFGHSAVGTAGLLVVRERLFPFVGAGVVVSPFVPHGCDGITGAAAGAMVVGVGVKDIIFDVLDGAVVRTDGVWA